MNVLIVVSSLTGSRGGMEKNACVLANYLAPSVGTLTLLSFDPSSKPLSYFLTQSVNHVRTENRKSEWVPLMQKIPLDFFKDTYLIYKEIKNVQAEVVISFGLICNVLSIIAARSARIKCVISIRNNPVRTRIHWGWRMLRFWMYRFATCVVFQTQGQKACLSQSLRQRTHVIPSPVTDSHSKERQKAICKPCIITVSRLHEVKGVDILLEAFKDLSQKYPKWNLYILGDGPQKDDLQKIIAGHDCANRVYFIGEVSNPDDYLRESDIFVLPSRAEGFPNALLEAMVCGLPVIAADCDFGPRDIIRHNHDGLLVATQSAGALCKALIDLVENPKKRKYLGENAKKINKRYSLDRIIEMWLSVLNS